MNHFVAIEPRNHTHYLDPVYFQATLLSTIEARKVVRVRKRPRSWGKPKPPLRQCRDIAELCLAEDLSA